MAVIYPKDFIRCIRPSRYSYQPKVRNLPLQALALLEKEMSQEVQFDKTETEKFSEVLNKSLEALVESSKTLDLGKEANVNFILACLDEISDNVLARANFMEMSNNEARRLEKLHSAHTGRTVHRNTASLVEATKSGYQPKEPEQKVEDQN